MDGVTRKGVLGCYPCFLGGREKSGQVTPPFPTREPPCLPVQFLMVARRVGYNGTLRISDTLRDWQAFPSWLFPAPGESPGRQTGAVREGEQALSEALGALMGSRLVGVVLGDEAEA